VNVNTIERPDIQSVIAQMRAMREAAQGEWLLTAQEPDVADARPSIGPAQHTEGPTRSFGTMLADAIKQVNETQSEATRLSNAFVKGESQDLVSTMVALQKSSVAFQAVTQVRNKLVNAYQDIMNMPI
jgi:flagellar hook-basal body complex protein FliE